jgi:hypothetical protein
MIDAGPRDQFLPRRREVCLGVPRYRVNANCDADVDGSSFILLYPSVIFGFTCQIIRDTFVASL